jgi:hypothetical protein
MKYETKPFTFNVAYHAAPLQVSGLAINCELPKRLTVHKNDLGLWVVSDFGTGRAVFTGDIFTLKDEERLPTMDETIKSALEKCAKLIASGYYARAEAKYKAINK